MSGWLSPASKTSWDLRSAGHTIVHACEVLVVSAAAFLVIASVILAALILYVLFLGNILAGALTSIESLPALQAAVERVFAGILLLLLGLELLKSLTSFFVARHLQLEIIVVVAMIAVVRHIMLVDFDHVQPLSLLGAAGLILALAISYALVRQRTPESAEPDA